MMIVDGPPSVGIDKNVVPLVGAWSDDEGIVGCVAEGLEVPEENPMSMQLSHEEVVVGCVDGTI